MAYQANRNIAVDASATAALARIPTWATDFRADLDKIDVPMLVIQDDADQVLPLEKTGDQLPRPDQRSAIGGAVAAPQKGSTPCLGFTSSASTSKASCFALAESCQKSASPV